MSYILSFKAYSNFSYIAFLLNLMAGNFGGEMLTYGVATNVSSGFGVEAFTTSCFDVVSYVNWSYGVGASLVSCFGD